MLLDWIVELKDNVDKHGIRFGLILTLYAIYRKERRNYRLDKRDELHNAYFAAILANQRKIMDKLGVEGEWDGRLMTSAKTGRVNLRLLSIGSYMESLKNLFHFLRREKKMNQTNWLTLLPALVGALKLILQPFGVDLSHITDIQVNDVANGVAALLTIIGVFLPHRKGASTDGLSQPSNTITSNK